MWNWGMPSYRIAGKFGEEFNLVVLWIDVPTAKLKSVKN